MKSIICVILDRSGSMAGKESDVVGGVNKLIAEQKELPDPASIALVRFDTGATERFRAMVDLQNCAPITLADYQPRGGTPLLDALGTSITQLDEDWKHESADRCIVVIVTDGLENASKEYTKEKIKAMIEARQASGKWAFVYLGANVDSFSEAGQYGISAHNTANYSATAKGIAAAYGTLSASTAYMRTSGDMNAKLGGDISEDGKLENIVAGKPAPTRKEAPWTPPADAPSRTENWTPPA